MSRGKEVEISSLVVVADTHCGCGLGLCPPHRIKLDQGGFYLPSRFQRKVWRWWRKFWDEWVPLATRGEPFGVVHGGDIIDYRHHGSTTQISQNIDDQSAIADEIMAPIVEQCEGRYWQIRGTEAHSGPSSEAEETLAKQLGAIPNELGQHARYELWKWVGGRAILVNVMHHIGTTGSSAYESTAVFKEMVEAFVESARWGNRAPDVVVRAHRHRFMRTEVASSRGRAVSVVVPGWQGKTPFLHRTAGARQSQPQFGGILVRLSDEGEPYVRHQVWKLSRPKPE